MLLIFIFTFFLSLPHDLYAHKVNIYAYTDGDMVYSESYFADGSRCKNCAIEVYDKNTEKLLIEGKTDENGKFSFKSPQSPSIKILLKAGAGHQNSYVLKLRDIPVEKNIKDITQKSVKVHNVDITRIQCLSASEIEFIVNQALDKKIQPLMNQISMLQESTNKAGVVQILGGIGYIIGIMGIIMYFKNRKKQG